MCGITGVIDLQASPGSPELQSAVQRMTDALARRGPDDAGIWVSKTQPLALGQRRLAILELSELGHQPIKSSSGRYMMTFNGEIYNFVEIAAKLTRYRDDFAASSDTQVMLAAFEQWGVTEAVKRFDGMFAILCVDQEENILHVVRDRLGEKPLYLGCHENKILFSSELKAMQSVFGAKPELDRKALTLFLRHGYVPSPYSIYQNIYKLQSASILSLDLRRVREIVEQPWKLVSLVKKYWVLQETSTLHSATEKSFEKLLSNVVERQMRSDVPLGAFLSGGVDSSTIVALMQRVSSKPVQTFSIGFENEAFNEAPYAKDVAQHLRTDHHERILTAQEVMKVIPDLGSIYDEPFADSSQLPTILVSQIAREQVTVCLSGDGGDELFGGYERYHWAQKIWHSFSWMPYQSRKLIAELLRLIGLINKLSYSCKSTNYLTKFHRLASMLAEKERQYFYRVLISSVVDPQSYVIGGEEPEYGLTQSTMTEENFLHQMMYLDIHNYLPDDILTKVDRASMYSSLELRAPLLDHRVVESAWSLRSIALSSNNNTKAVLRNILYQYVPKALIERPKKGFAIPLESWLQGPLKQWAQSYMSRASLEQSSIFEVDTVMSAWNNFLVGKTGSQHFLWNILMFELWREAWG